MGNKVGEQVKDPQSNQKKTLHAFTTRSTGSSKSPVQAIEN